MNVKLNEQRDLNVLTKNEIYFKDTIALNLFSGYNNNEVIYTTNNNVCELVNNQLFAKRAGICVITATLSNDNEYNSCSVSLFLCFISLL